ncbi:tetratricopeptide repeat protein [Micromonospora sp. RP3T]|uniref:tetratricopeptide repeat protein n=1 Tax=Micromonospora sp. RP3T TaxID=2135446 RepID=UPI000D17195C|nr:tetratricopeptide repeat protein [Micromonospora sp. RP3T]PTA43232.1 hypothetical protein C8054_26590 [Micromonospora sp. RP3T]
MDQKADNALHAVRRHAAEGDYASAVSTAAAAIEALDAGPGDRDLLVVMLNELGMLFKYLGRLDEAEHLYERSLSLLSTPPTRAGDLAAVLHNQAGLAHVKRDLGRAERLARVGIAVRTAQPRFDGRALVADEAALAAILIDSGSWAEAERLLESCLDHQRREYGSVHHEVAVTLHNLGSLLFRQGDAAAASIPLQESLSIKVTCLGEDHLDLTPTLYNLASCCEAVGDLASVRHLLTWAVSILRPQVPSSQATYAACLRKLARLPAEIPAGGNGVERVGHDRTGVTNASTRRDL